MQIEVLMSTYNGQCYIEEQIKSIMEQSMVDVVLTIRDDGSSDSTIEIIKKMMLKYPDKIYLYEGKNVGYKRSFIQLLSLAQGKSQFYAFSDQDDIWKNEKCIHAIKCMKDEYDLYVSSVENCNEDLEMLSKNDLTTGKQSLMSDFARHRFPGCAMVFTENVRNKSVLVSRKVESDDHMPSHDFVVSAVAFLIGKVYVDAGSYVLHRRTGDSLTSKGKGIINRIKIEWQVLFKTQNECFHMANMLSLGIHIDDDNGNRVFLDKVLNYKKSLKNRMELIFFEGFSSGMLLCDLETKFKILINRY